MNPYQTIELDRDKKEHLYLQLFKALEVMIASGRLRPHTKLPPIRKLAELLDVNNVTIVNAYKLLEEGGLVYKKVGSGTFVTPKEEEIEDQEDKPKQAAEMSFAQSSPTADLFPVADFKMVLNEVLDRDKGKAFGYQASWGFSPLRESVVDYLKDSKIYVDPDVIQVISGAQQGIDIVSKAILNYGDYVLVEAPSYTGAIAAFKMKGANIIEVPMTQDGIHLEAFKEAVKKYKPKLFYTMPNLHNPTGYTYSHEKKKAVLDVASENRMWVLEDDYASDLFFYEGEDAEGTSLKSMDQYDRVIYIKSFSKIYMPGLRLGFMAAPKRLGQELVVAKHITDISTSGLIQRAFDLYLRRGLWKKQIESMRDIFKKRYDTAVKAINTYMPADCSYHQPEGGLNFWIEMPAYLNADSFAQFALSRGIEIIPGSAFYFAQGKSNCFRISVAGVYLENIDDWILKLMQVLDAYIISHSDRQSRGNEFLPVL